MKLKCYYDVQTTILHNASSITGSVKFNRLYLFEGEIHVSFLLQMFRDNQSLLKVK